MLLQYFYAVWESVSCEVFFVFLTLLPLKAVLYRLCLIAYVFWRATDFVDKAELGFIHSRQFS